MNDNTLNILIPLLKDFFFLTGFVFFLISLVIGLLMIIQPGIIIRLNKKSGKGHSLRKSTKFLEELSNIDPLFYKHHRIIGAIVSMVSVYVLYYFLRIYDSVIIAEIFDGSNYAVVYAMLIDALRVFMLVSSVFILLIGVVIFIRPSQIKKVEVWANRWISTRQGSKELSVEREQVNNFAYRYPRFTGLIIVSISLYASIMLFLFYTQ